MTHADIVAALGVDALAAVCGVKPDAVYSWRRGTRRIPSDHWFAIAKMPAAVSHGITLETLITADNSAR